MAKMGEGEVLKTNTEEGDNVVVVMQSKEEGHPYAFHVSGPRNVPSPNWKDFFSSSWKDGNYKRSVIACFIQAVYLLEIDRQENRTAENALAPKWWTPFKYKLVETLIDERDGSIYGGVLEWDRSAAMADYLLMKPAGAPRAVLALRGTLLKSSTLRRDIEDDLRFLAWESLKGSVRFSGALKALKSIVDKHGSNNVCIAGHSLGAGFALQVGKALAKDGIYVEAHLFNPPSVSLAHSFKTIGEKAGFMWRRMRSMFPMNGENQEQVDNEATTSALPAGMKQWVPHLYVNNSDYICCYYTDPDGVEGSPADKENARPQSKANFGAQAKLFVLSKGKQKFLEAHGLEQWWSDDLELQMALQNSKLISRQLKSLYSLPAPTAPQQTQGKLQSWQSS
ncbi:OLC1v1023503C1 [Oldenlandia corymbosa var. corymbosa]|uniref:OLC1v1023503C1 n=1 Tax=Oldenlandia corymbosa var. corymbosa TaxID=529605 RepID=A0AAV1C1S8_OLDCO|nr:OLC1v1023503C1 [Oldenlandia corymbosa var. corymbosa]